MFNFFEDQLCKLCEVCSEILTYFRFLTTKKKNCKNETPIINTTEGQERIQNLNIEDNQDLNSDEAIPHEDEQLFDSVEEIVENPNNIVQNDSINDSSVNKYEMHIEVPVDVHISSENNSNFTENLAETYLRRSQKNIDHPTYLDDYILYTLPMLKIPKILKHLKVISKKK